MFFLTVSADKKDKNRPQLAAKGSFKRTNMTFFAFFSSPVVCGLIAGHSTAVFPGGDAGLGRQGRKGKARVFGVPLEQLILDPERQAIWHIR